MNFFVGGQELMMTSQLQELSGQPDHPVLKQFLQGTQKKGINNIVPRLNISSFHDNFNSKVVGGDIFFFF